MRDETIYFGQKINANFCNLNKQIRDWVPNTTVRKKSGGIDAIENIGRSNWIWAVHLARVSEDT